MTQLQFFREQPRCPGCGANNVATETPTTGRCQRCGWRIRIAADGAAQSWLKIGTPKKRPRPVSVK